MGYGFTSTRRLIAAGLALLAAAVCTAAPQTAHAATIEQANWGYKVKGGWGGGYFYTVGVRTDQSGTVRNEAHAVASGTVYAYGWSPSPLMAAGLYAENLSNGTSRTRLIAESLGRIIYQSTNTASAEVVIPIVGAAASKSFSILGVNFATSGYAGGVVGVEGITPLVQTSLIGLQAEPMASVGLSGRVSVNSVVAGFEAGGNLTALRISLPTSALYNYSSRFFHVNSDLDVKLVNGTIYARGWVLLTHQTFIDVTTGWLYQYSRNVINQSGVI